MGPRTVPNPLQHSHCTGFIISLFHYFAFLMFYFAILLFNNLLFHYFTGLCQQFIILLFHYFINISLLLLLLCFASSIIIIIFIIIIIIFIIIIILLEDLPKKIKCPHNCVSQKNRQKASTEASISFYPYYRKKKEIKKKKNLMPSSLFICLTVSSRVIRLSLLCIAKLASGQNQHSGDANQVCTWHGLLVLSGKIKQQRTF